MQPAGAAPAAVTLGNTDAEIGGLTISDPPTQAEELADDVRALSALTVSRQQLVQADLIAYQTPLYRAAGQVMR